MQPLPTGAKSTVGRGFLLVCMKGGGAYDCLI